jgi:hypothetical protein
MQRTLLVPLTGTAGLPVECQPLLQVNLPQLHPPQQTAARVPQQLQHCLALLPAWLPLLLLLPLGVAVMLLLLLLHRAEAFCPRVHLLYLVLLLLRHHLLLLVLRLECSQAREYHFPWHPCTRSR